MKHLFFVVTFLFGLTAAQAQQDPQFTQFMFFNLGFNPGYAGTSDSLLNTTAAYRDQWVGFSGNPKTFLFCADAPVKAFHGGFGLKFMDDRLGNFHFTRASISYSFHKRIRENGLLGVGVEGEFARSAVTNNWLAPDGTNGANDPAIPTQNTTSYSGNFGLGAYFRNYRWNIGLSAGHLLPDLSQSSSYQAARHYYLTTGYNFYFGKRIRVTPSVLIKSDAVVTTFDINTIIYWNKWVWAGVSYRLQDAVAGMVGFAFRIRKSSLLKIGYSYDLGTSNLKPYHNNTHEVFLNYSLKIRKKTV